MCTSLPLPRPFDLPGLLAYPWTGTSVAVAEVIRPVLVEWRGPGSIEETLKHKLFEVDRNSRYPPGETIADCGSGDGHETDVLTRELGGVYHPTSARDNL